MGRATRGLAQAWLAFLASCASIMTGSSDAVAIDSEPSGAFFTTNLGHQGSTPSTLRVPDDVTLEVHITRDGYRDVDVVLEPRLSAWIFANLISAGPLGLVVDLVSGNWRTHAGELRATLMPAGS